jgi:hypothetical protein
MLVNLGGHTTKQIDERRYVVEYEASPPTPDDTIVKYIEYRCATLALEKGYDGFQYEVPIYASPPRPQTKKHFGTRIQLVKKPFLDGQNIVDADELQTRLKPFIEKNSR